MNKHQVHFQTAVTTAVIVFGISLVIGFFILLNMYPAIFGPILLLIIVLALIALIYSFAYTHYMEQAEWQRIQDAAQLSREETRRLIQQYRENHTHED